MAVMNVPGGWGSCEACDHCPKKADPSITDHSCCGRCLQGREHLREAQSSYSGAGTFFHTYWEALLFPGVCATCGEPKDSH
jgi:hypothetical protein